MPEGTVDVRVVAADLKDTAAQAAAHPRATADDWSKLFEKAAIYASLPLAAWLSHPGPYNTDYELSDQDANAIFMPLSRMVARSKINQRWGHVAMQGIEYVDCVAAIIGYGATIAPAIGAKIARHAPPPPRNVGVMNNERNRQPAARPSAPAEPNGAKHAVVPSAEWQPPESIHVWTPADITESGAID